MARGEAYKIDLWETPLWANEPKKDPRLVWCIYNAIQRGEQLPPVPVYRLEEGRGFHISRREAAPGMPGLVDGGHHRALAHLIAETPLDVRVIKERHQRPYLGSLPLFMIDFLESDIAISSRQTNYSCYDDARNISYDLDFMRGQLACVEEILGTQQVLHGNTSPLALR